MTRNLLFFIHNLFKICHLVIFSILTHSMHRDILLKKKMSDYCVKGNLNNKKFRIKKLSHSFIWQRFNFNSIFNPYNIIIMKWCFLSIKAIIRAKSQHFDKVFQKKVFFTLSFNVHAYGNLYQYPNCATSQCNPVYIICYYGIELRPTRMWRLFLQSEPNYESLFFRISLETPLGN